MECKSVYKLTGVVVSSYCIRKSFLGLHLASSVYFLCRVLRVDSWPIPSAAEAPFEAPIDQQR